MKRAAPFLKLGVIAIGVILVLLVMGLFLLRVTRIEPGHVGVQINLAGNQRGASEIPVRTGWVVYSPLSTEIIEFPTYVQTVKWTKDVNEGHPINEEMGFNSKEGMEIFVDVSLSYAIEAGESAGLLREVSRVGHGYFHARHPARRCAQFAERGGIHIHS